MLNNSPTCAHVLVPWIESVASKNSHGHGDIASNTIRCKRDPATLRPPLGFIKTDDIAVRTGRHLFM